MRYLLLGIGGIFTLLGFAVPFYHYCLQRLFYLSLYSVLRRVPIVFMIGLYKQRCIKLTLKIFVNIVAIR